MDQYRLTGTVTDDVAIATVEVQINAGGYTALVTNPGASYAIDHVFGVAPGTETVTVDVRATDTSDNVRNVQVVFPSTNDVTYGGVTVTYLGQGVTYSA
jgi:hypothetical protein